MLLNIAQSQELLHEGTAREVVNRIQRLRKKAGLVPTDDILVYYDVTPPQAELQGVLGTFTEYIKNVIKKPFCKFPVPVGQDVVVGESQTLKGATEAMLHITICGGPGFLNKTKRLLTAV